jgi:LPS export ABC transporter permease LptF/LPS export ABC transporter permease LptG
LWNATCLWKTLCTGGTLPFRTNFCELQPASGNRHVLPVLSTPVKSRRHFILSRALIRETLPSLVLATGATTFLLFIRALFFLAELFVSRNVAPASALRLLSLNIPNILALTLPIGALFAVLMTTARCSADSELIALQACGVRLIRVAGPLLVVALAVFVVNFANMWWLMPRTNLQFRMLQQKLRLSVGAALLQPKEFVEDFQGYLLYVDRIDQDTGRWHGIVLFDTRNPLEEQLVLARSGRYSTNQIDGSATLSLEDVTTHVLAPDQPSKYRRNANRTLEIFLRPRGPDPSQRTRWGPRETTSSELLARLAGSDGSTPEEQIEARIELHKRVATPAAALIFVLVGFPLGARNRRGAKGFGLTASVLLVVLYYVLLTNGELLATNGRLPPALGAWLPNLVLAGIGGILIRQLVHGRPHVGASGRWWLPGWTGRWVHVLVDWRQRRDQGRSRARVAWGATARWFPSLGILDAHVVRLCLGFLALVLVAVCALWITVNLTENLDDIQRNKPALGVVASYYAFLLPQILRDILPLAFLIAFLGTTATLERHNETTALKASGISLTRVMLPLLMLGLGLAVGLFVMDDQLTPRANRAGQRLADIIRGKKQARSHRATDRQWLFLPDGRTLLNFMEYDADTSTLVRPAILVFDQDMDLRARYMARKATFEDGRWRSEGAWSRTFLPDGRTDYVPPLARATELPLRVGTEYLGQEYRRAAQMSFAELGEYIRTLRAAGYRVDHLRVQLHQKIAYPLALVLLPWLSLSFAFQVVRRGTMMGIALALVLGMVYFAVLAFSTRLGEASLIPPMLAAWTPTVLFALLAVNRHTYLKT